MEYFGLKLDQDFGNRATYPYQEFRGVPLPGRIHNQPVIWYLLSVTDNTLDQLFHLESAVE